MTVTTVVNRRSIPVEALFDGAVYRWEPGEKKVLPAHMAYNLVPQTALQMNVETGQTIYALGIEGSASYPATPLEGKLAKENGVELLWRADSPEEDAPLVMSMDATEAPQPKEEAVSAGKSFRVVKTGVELPKGPQNPGYWSGASGSKSA